MDQIIATSKTSKSLNVPRSLLLVITLCTATFHTTVWNTSLTFEDIFQDYVECVMRHYGSKVMVIFADYSIDPSHKGTKTAERARGVQGKLIIISGV